MFKVYLLGALFAAQPANAGTGSSTRDSAEALVALVKRETNERAERLKRASSFELVFKAQPSLFEWGMEGPLDLSLGAFVRSSLEHDVALGMMADIGLLRNAHGAVGASQSGEDATFFASGVVKNVTYRKHLLVTDHYYHYYL